MADNRTMAQLLQAPTEGYEDAIVIPEINANFELKHGLINLVQNKQFFGHDKEDPHAHIRYFNKITSTMRFPDIPSTSIKLMLFPFSLEGSARIWLEKEPPRSILTWDDLVSKFINQFFPPSKTTSFDTCSTPRVNHQFTSSTLSAPAQQMQGVSKTDFENYVKANDAVLRNMQNQGQGSLPSRTRVIDCEPDPSSTLIQGRCFYLDRLALIDVSKKGTFIFSKHSLLVILHLLLNKKVLAGIQKGIKIFVMQTKTAKSSIDEPPEVELKDLPPHLEYAFLEDNNKLPVIIAKDLSDDEKTALIKVLKSRKRAIAWKLSDIKGINPEFCSHKILMEEDYEPAVQHQRRVNPKIHDVIKKEVEKLLDAGLIYPISDSPWVSPVHCVRKKGGVTVVTNDENELVPTRLVTGWRVCIDYRKLNEATRKDHFPLPFMDQMLERLAGNEYYCFLDGFSGYFQIPIDPKDQEKTTFTCPYGTFAYRRMLFGLCTDNAKISRKRSKPDNHEHGNGIECANAGECYQGQQKSTYGQQW
ncbi:hypothetical protein Tco_1109418 [Tanacetum coccineum]